MTTNATCDRLTIWKTYVKIYIQGVFSDKGCNTMKDVQVKDIPIEDLFRIISTTAYTQEIAQRVSEIKEIQQRFNFSSSQRGKFLAKAISRKARIDSRRRIGKMRLEVKHAKD